MNKPSYILGVSESHTASAALLKNGEIIAAASEERFTRRKLQAGIPKNAIKFCLDFAQIKPRDLTLVAVADLTPPKFDLQNYPSFQYQNFLQGLIVKLLLNIEEQIETKLPQTQELFFDLYKKTSSLLQSARQKKRISQIQKILPVESQKLTFIKHHECHAVAALFCAPNTPKDEATLIFTADGVGDFESATVSIYKSGKIKKVVSVNSQQSLGFFYQHITQYLGMKPIEDEYKVMGLAPYADPQKAQNVYKILRAYFDIDKSQNRWTIKISEFHLSRLLPKILEFKRFDYIAYAAQRILEEILVEWVRNAIDKYQISNIALGGGVFANVKVNQKISRSKNAKSVFCMPSPSDESNAIGAAYSLYFSQTGKIPSSLNTLYLGPSFSKGEIEQEVKSFKISKTYKVQNPKDINREIAKLLADGEVVARFSGCMEFGQRALGNRSILANPKDRNIVEFINSAIKNRDFWMPFAPTILRERAKDYLITHKADSPFMNVAYETTEKGQHDLAAAIHPYDKTTRPQILDKDVNPSYYDLIKKFEKNTGIGAILNTSFNLHGDPIVCSPQDAITTFKNSGLKYLAIENYLITKR